MFTVATIETFVFMPFGAIETLMIKKSYGFSNATFC